MARAVSYSTTNKNQGKGRRKGNVNVSFDTLNLTSSLTWYTPPAVAYDQRLIISDTTVPTAGEDVTPMFLVCNDDSEVISYVNGMPGSAASVSTLADAYAYIADNDLGLILGPQEYPIKTDELRLDLNTQMPSSYPQTGTNLYDLSGNENDATITGATWDSDYLQLELDGSNDYINISSTSDFGSGETNFSWEFWVAPTFGAGSTEGLVSYTSGIDNRFFIGLSATSFVVETTGTGAGDYSYNVGDITSYITSGELTQVVFTFDTNNSKYRVYVNGENHGGDRSFASSINSINNVYLFVYQFEGFQHHFDGKTSCVRYYTKTLSDDDVYCNYYSMNTFINGDFRHGTNFNFSNEGTWSTTTPVTGFPAQITCPQVRQSGRLSSEFIEVNTAEKYLWQLATRTMTQGGSSGTGLTGGHKGFACYNKDYQFIDLRNCGGIANTTLSRDLVAGDTYAYVNDDNISSWRAVDSQYYFRHFCLNPAQSDDWGMPWGFTRVGYGSYNIYYNEITDVGGGEYRFKFFTSGGVATTFPNIGFDTPAGTPVFNGVAGGTYNYVKYPATGAFGSWSEYQSSVFSGEDRNSSTPFRFATKYVKFLDLVNYAVPAETPYPIGAIGYAYLQQVQ